MRGIDSNRDSSRFELRQRIRYRFDNLLGRGTWATLLWLGILTLAVVAISALLLNLFEVTFTGSEDASYLEDFWQSLLRTIDPGTMAGDVGWGRRVLALLVTIFGILVAGTLIGVIAAGVEGAIDRMRRGQSAIFESGHVVVLGTSDRLPTLIGQLVLSKSRRAKSVIVVMADRDPAEMHDEVRAVVSDFMGSRLVFRSGDPTNPADLARMSVRNAGTVIILGDETLGDARAIKTVVALQRELGDLDRLPIVVELADPKSAEDLTRVFANGVHPIVPRLAVARIAAFALREPGIGQVTLALLDDRGSDVHISSQPDHDGMQFAEVVERLSEARPIGRVTADGITELNPAPETELEAGDRLVVISDKPDGLSWTDRGHVATPAPGDGQLPARFDRPDQRILVLGWSDLGAHMLSDWSGIATAASTVEVLVDPAFVDVKEIAVLESEGPKVNVTQVEGPPDLGSRLAAPARIDTILILGYARLGPERADTRTLLELVSVRSTLRTLDGHVPRVIVELLDVDSIPLADMPNPDDLVVSESIGSQLIAQLAEQPERRPVFLDLYAPTGPSIHLIPAGSLGIAGRRPAWEVFRSSYAQGVLAIGWRLSAQRGGTLVLNPPDLGEVDLEDDDQIIVIA